MLRGSLECEEGVSVARPLMITDHVTQEEEAVLQLVGEEEGEEKQEEECGDQPGGHSGGGGEGEKMPTCHSLGRWIAWTTTTTMVSTTLAT